MKIFFVSLTLFCFSSLSGKAQQAPLVITKLSGDYYIYTTWNTYKGTQVDANGLYLVTNAGVVLIDCPWDTTQLQPLLDSIQARHHKKVILHIATHSHEDRSAGLDFYAKQGIATYTSVQTDRILEQHNKNRAANLIQKDTTFKAGQYSFQIFYPGPGHTSDNIVVWFGQQKILYGGCFVKSTEATDLGNLADADARAWPSSIQNILKTFGEPKYVIPGHQSWESNQSLQHTLMLLQKKNGY